MRRSKLPIVILALLLVFSLSACAPEVTTANSPTSDESKATVATTSEKKIVIGFANLTDTLDFGKVVKAGIIEEAKKRGYDLIALDNERTGTKAIENAQTIATRGVDVFIEFNVDISVAPTIMEIMNEAKIPVIAIDIPHPGAPFFGANNWVSGQITGQALVDKAKAEWNGVCDLLILAENAKAGDTVKQRIKGIHDIVQRELKLTDSQILYVDGQGDLLKTQEQIAAALTANPDKHNILIGTLQDPMGQGALAAVEAAGRQKDVWLASQGADVPGLTNLRLPEDNCWFGTTAFFPEKYGEYVFAIVDKILAGEEVPDQNYVEHLFIDKKNLDEYYPQK